VAKTTAQSVGARLEQLALDHLQEAGLKLVTRNFRCRVGELDLVMLDRGCLVFVEVRYRKPNRFASALESIDVHKRRKLAKAALFFLGRHKAFQQHTVRFDVIAFDGPAPDRYRLQWLKDAFRPD
jgi:putative endonuclease